MSAIKLILVLCVFIASVLAGLPTPKASISASLRDKSVDGLQGLNIRAVFPFKFDEYVVGFKHSFTSFGRAPDALFVKRSFDTDEVMGHVSAEYNTISNVGSYNTGLVSKRFGVAVDVEGDSKHYFNSAVLSTAQQVQNMNVGLAAKFDKPASKLAAKAFVQKDGTTVSLEYDTIDRRPELSVEQHINENNIVNPTISLTNGDITYAWIRRWAGGSLRSSLHPGDKLTFDWRDDTFSNGDNGSGSWNTHAEVPIDDISKAKVSISRDWKY